MRKGQSNGTTSVRNKSEKIKQKYINRDLTKLSENSSKNKDKKQKVENMLILKERFCVWNKRIDEFVEKRRRVTECFLGLRGYFRKPRDYIEKTV